MSIECTVVGCSGPDNCRKKQLLDGAVEIYEEQATRFIKSYKARYYVELTIKEARDAVRSDYFEDVDQIMKRCKNCPLP